MSEPRPRQSSTDLAPGALWRSKRDGRVFEVVYVPPYAQDRVQLRPAWAKNLKNTRWLDVARLPRLYDRLTENDTPVGMDDLEIGDIWELPGGKRVEVLDRAFLSGGIRWVAVFDHDFTDSDPLLFKVTRFNGGRRVN